MLPRVDDGVISRNCFFRRSKTAEVVFPAHDTESAVAFAINNFLIRGGSGAVELNKKQ